MGRRTMKPEGMRLEIKMDENEGRIKKVRVVFLKGDEELTVKMSMEQLMALKGVADQILMQEAATSGDDWIPGYV